MINLNEIMGLRIQTPDFRVKVPPLLSGLFVPPSKTSTTTSSTTSNTTSNTTSTTSNKVAAQTTGVMTDYLSGQTSKMFGDSELGALLGNLFSQGILAAGDTMTDNLLKGSSLMSGVSENAVTSIGGAGVGIASNYIGKGINSLLGDSKLSRGIGQGVATGLGTVGGMAIQGALKGVEGVKGLAGAANAVNLINPVGLGMNIAGSALGAALGPSKEYGGKYGSITKTADTVYDAMMGGMALSGVGAPLVGALALNKGLSNLFGSTDGMSVQDAILGSAFMPAPIKWLNAGFGKTTGEFNNQSSYNVNKTNQFMLDSFGDLSSRFDRARDEQSKTYGLFSRGAYNKAQDNIDFSNNAFKQVLAMANKNELQNIRSLDMTSINNLRYALMINGGWNPTLIGKNGMKIFNNATNHNIGMRLLSAAALIDNKQMILSAQGGTKVMRPRMKPHRKGELPVYTEEEKQLLAEWDAHLEEVKKQQKEAIERRNETNARHTLHYSNLATGIAETAQQNAQFEPVTQESLQNSNTERLRQELLADKNEYFDNGMKFIEAVGLADLGINVAAPLLQRGFRWAFNKAGLLVKVPKMAYSAEVKSPYYKIGQDGNLTFDTQNVVSEIKAGKLDFINEMLSPEYAEAAIRNMEEAEKMGLSYTPVFEKAGFKSLREDGIIPKFIQDSKHTWHARTGFMGGTPGKATEIEYNISLPTNIRYSTGHESGHVSRWGMGESKSELEFMKYKANQIFKDNGDVGVYEFGSLTGEGATNMRDLGKLMGITLRTPYPGYEKALEMLKNAEKTSNKGGIVKVLKLTKDAMPYIWRALQGLHFEYAVPTALTATTLYNTNK